MLKHKEMYKSFFPLLAAIAVQQLLALLVNLVDNIMLGAYSETALSGAALVNQIQYVLQMITSGIGAGAAVLGAQYWGKRELKPIRSVISIGLKISLIAGIVFTFAAIFFPYRLLGLLCNDPDTLEQGVRYLSLMCWTYLIYSASAALMYSLRAVQIAWFGSIM